MAPHPETDRPFVVPPHPPPGLAMLVIPPHVHTVGCGAFAVVTEFSVTLAELNNRATVQENAGIRSALHVETHGEHRGRPESVNALPAFQNLGAHGHRSLASP